MYITDVYQYYKTQITEKRGKMVTLKNRVSLTVCDNGSFIIALFKHCLLPEVYHMCA